MGDWTYCSGFDPSWLAEGAALGYQCCAVCVSGQTTGDASVAYAFILVDDTWTSREQVNKTLTADGQNATFCGARFMPGGDASMVTMLLYDEGVREIASVYWFS